MSIKSSFNSQPITPSETPALSREQAIFLIAWVMGARAYDAPEEYARLRSEALAAFDAARTDAGMPGLKELLDGRAK